MDAANADEAVREAMLDIEEGADAIMVTGGPYLDIVQRGEVGRPAFRLGRIR